MFHKKVWGAVKEAFTGNEAAAAEQRASQARERLSAMQQQREKQGLVKESRRASAEVAVQAQTQGVGSSSSGISSLGNITNQAASNISFLDKSAGLQTYAGDQAQRAANIRGRSERIRGGVQFGLQLGSMAGL